MNTTLTHRTLTDSQMKQWEDDGYLHVKNVVNSETICQVNAMFESVVDDFIGLLNQKGLINSHFKDLPHEVRLAEATKTCRKEYRSILARSMRAVISRAPVYQLHTDPGLVAVLRDLMGDEIMAAPAYNGRPNLPKDEFTTVPWHQDLGYYGQTAKDCLLLTSWMPLVPVTTDMGAMQVIRGSHKWGYIEHFGGKNEGAFLETAQFDFKPEDVITFEMQPGDALIFNSLTMHRSVSNVSDKIRWSIDLRYGVPGQYQGTDLNLVWYEKDLSKADQPWIPSNKQWIVSSERQPLTSLKEWDTMIQNWYGEYSHKFPV